MSNKCTSEFSDRLLIQYLQLGLGMHNIRMRSHKICSACAVRAADRASAQYECADEQAPMRHDATCADPAPNALLILIPTGHCQQKHLTQAQPAMQCERHCWAHCTA